ncbi:uncharacterized protein LOC18010075 [Eutrema salsugineum]|uniref:uncharacterized protein LOC18010075 n=1 Tax=Eutrema salsugineum TaxID=72664 RepID=UPI000CED3A56|nr:uncharacterized protein LOC18010075 [Eutrema salsugineum]
MRLLRITIRKLSASNYLFHIPDESTRSWVLQRGLWHVDGCLMFVASWTPEVSLAIPEIKTILVWVTLKNIPNILYSIPEISHIALGLGAPMATHKPRLDPILMGEAKILVEVDLSKAFPTRIADLNGFISMVDVEYAWLPSKCGRFGQLGHKIKRCLQEENVSNVVDNTTKETVLMVDLDVAGVSNSAPISALNHSSSAPAISIDIPATNNLTVDLVKDSIMEAISPVTTASTIENVTVPTAYQAPLSTTSNNVIESSFLEAARSMNAQAKSTVQRESMRLAELDLGSNKFASLISHEEGKDSSDSENDSDSMDLMTLSGKRILRERPVKPSTKAKEMNWQSTGRGRGNRRRGNRGGRG